MNHATMEHSAGLTANSFILKIQTIHELNQIKQTTQNTAKQNYPGSVASYDTRPGNKVGLFYNAPEPTRG